MRCKLYWFHAKHKTMLSYWNIYMYTSHALTTHKSYHKQHSGNIMFQMNEQLTRTNLSSNCIDHNFRTQKEGWNAVVIKRHIWDALQVPSSRGLIPRGLQLHLQLLQLWRHTLRFGRATAHTRQLRQQLCNTSQHWRHRYTRIQRNNKDFEHKQN